MARSFSCGDGSASDLAPRGVELSDAEVDEAMALMEAIGGADISEYRDTYRDAVEPGRVVELMAALRDSVRAAQEARGESADEAEVHQMRPQKKTPAKKTAAKKTVS